MFPAPAEAALTLIVAAGGGGGAGVINGSGAQITTSGGDGLGGGGVGGTNGFGGFGGQGLGGAANGAGGAGWLGGGGAGLGGGEGGFSSPSFSGGAAAGAFSGGGGSIGLSGGGGGSYVNPALTDVDEIFDDNGTDAFDMALNGVVTVGAKIFDSTGSVVEYTIPTSKVYFILAIGAQGGASNGFQNIGGYGAGVGGAVYLTAGTELDIVVGGGGESSAGPGGGGGGGSFVWDPTAIPPQPIPEPSTWAMMLIGFAGLGYAGYRRARGERLAPAPRL